MIRMRHSVNNNTRMGQVIFLCSNSNHLIKFNFTLKRDRRLKFEGDSKSYQITNKGSIERAAQPTSSYFKGSSVHKKA